MSVILEAAFALPFGLRLEFPAYPVSEVLKDAGRFWAGVLAWSADVSARIAALTEGGYERAPALMLGMAVALALPLLALVGGITRWRLRRRERLRRPMDAPVRTVPASAAQLAGWLEAPEQPGVRYLIGQDLTRIGRAEDNEVRLPDKSIHRYHAVVERSPEMLFTIVDLSGRDGYGIRVDGEAVARVRLRDGDMVQIGGRMLRFRLGPPGAVPDVSGLDGGGLRERV